MKVWLVNTDGWLLYQKRLLRAGDGLLNLDSVRNLRFMTTRERLDKLG
ncbi:MAG: hypothetical protein ACPL5F_14200 [Moorellaceae bacterium]